MVKTKSGLNWRIEHTHRNVSKITINAQTGTNWEQWVLLRSDVHHDNPHCNQRLEREHLEQAKARDAIIIDNGDLFCAMQGKYDKRSSKDSLRPEHQSGEYLDKLVNTAAEFYAPYAQNFAVLGRGNHETAIRSRCETDLTERLAEKLRGYGSNVIAGGYGGWVRFQFRFGANKMIFSKLLHHYHGSGGGGPVTRGVIQTNRLGIFNPDADIILSGHTHDEWVMPIARQRVSASGKPYQDEQLHIRVPAYKDAWEDGFAGWEVEKMLAPKPIGAMWLRFYFADRTAKGDRQRRILMETLRAK